MRAIFRELPLYVVSEFPPETKDATDVIWVRYRGGLMENLARCRATFKGKSIRIAGVLLVPNVPFRRMRLPALILSPPGKPPAGKPRVLIASAGIRSPTEKLAAR